MEKFSCVIIALIVANFVFVDVKGRSLPHYITPHVCNRNDPKLAECLKNMVEMLRPMFAKGMPEINIPGLEPLRVPEVAITFDPKLVGVESTSDVVVTARDIRCYGLSDFKIKKLNAELEQFTYTVGLEFPTLKCEAEYSVDTRIGFIPIRGYGSINTNPTHMVANAVVKAKLVEKKAVKYIVFKGIDLKLDIEDGSLRLANNYKGSTLINRGFNALVNANSKRLIESFTPTFEKTVSDILMKLGNAASKNIVYDEILPA